MTSYLRPLLFGACVGAAAAATNRVVRDYREDGRAAEARLATVERKTVATAYGAVEWAEAGSGEPLLVSHGIFHGCDGGLLSVRDIVVDRRVVAPSRFGYLGSTMPEGATTADQADAFAALLDHLDIAQVDVVGISAGTTASLQFALRHPDRVTHLVVVSGSFPGSMTAVAPPSWARWLYADPPLWAMKVMARPRLARLMGVPAGFPHDAEETQVVAEMLESIFPVAPRAAGAAFDAYVSGPAVNDVPLESLTVPTMIVHAKDDPLCAFSAAERAAARIPGCVFVAHESGGHLGLGQTERDRTEIDAFLRTPARV